MTTLGRLGLSDLIFIIVIGCILFVFMPPSTPLLEVWYKRWHKRLLGALGVLLGFGLFLTMLAIWGVH